MAANKFPVSVIHAEIPPADRTEVIAGFRAGKVRVLISSGVLSRGVDFQSLSLVVNVDLCNDIHNYIHQVGRVGRYGRKGIAINLVSDRELPLMKSIEDHYKITINPLPDDFASLL
jgi:translation initiation factor 4A